MKPFLSSHPTSILSQLTNKLPLIFLLTCIPLFLFSQFGPEKIITTCVVCNPSDIYTADLNGDGDIDVLSASYNDDKIAWYENLGSNLFSDQIIISNNAAEAWCVHSADLDGDGDLDVVSGSRADDKIAWYENQFPTGVISQEKNINSFNIYPNPVTDILTLSFQDIIEGHYTINLIDDLGRNVYNSNRMVSNREVIIMDCSQLISGSYTLNLIHKKSGDMHTRRVVILR